MKRTHRSLRLFSTAVAVMAMGALLASSASASVLPAKFSSGTLKLASTAITLKANGAEAKTCTTGSGLSGTTESSFYYVHWGSEPVSEFGCTSSIQNLQMMTMGEVSYDTVTGKYTLPINSYTGFPLTSPWGYYHQEFQVNGTWVNGSGTTPSKVTFTAQPIGYTESGKKLTIEGTFTATTSTGGLITLSH